MLYRRHLRIKVLQALYAWYATQSNDLSKGERELLKSVNKLYELFIAQLSFQVEVKRFIENRLEERKGKFYPTAEDLNPNYKFVHNKVIELLENNKDFARKEEVFKINWSEETEMVRKFVSILLDSDIYQNYMSRPSSVLEDDKKLYLGITDSLLPEFELLRSYYEEKSVYFVDGYDLVNLLLIKFFETISMGFDENAKMPGIFKPDIEGGDEDLDFMIKLYKKVILKDEENTKILESKTKSWDYDRIPAMDIIILKMAIVELKEMETVPVKVTLNEYIELAKYFSAEKSKTFVNGVLDRLIKEFEEDGNIRKLGRGLIN